MVGHSEIEAEQADDGPEQPLSLAQSQTIDGAQRQRRGDRQVGVVRLPTSRGPWLSTPARDRRGGEPHHQAAALAQRLIVFSPIRHLMPLLRDVVTTIGIGLEWHGGILGLGWSKAHQYGAAPPNLRPTQGLWLRSPDHTP